MTASSAVRSKYDTPLRQAQRDHTRGRIRTAARELFYARRFSATTMDEIAAAAGLRRSTVYLHYRDKAEILNDLIADYVPKARKVLAGMPGPAPGVDALLRWIRRVVRFVAAERLPLSIIKELRRDRDYIPALESLTAELMSGLGERSARFRLAASPDADPAIRARGLLLFQELTYVCELALDQPDDARAKAALRVTAENLHAFLAADAEG